MTPKPSRRAGRISLQPSGLWVWQRLAAEGNTVVVIEHNLDVIKTADYIIDMGPDGGDRGGTVVVSGTPEEVAKHPTSYTAKYVKQYLEKDKK